MRDRYLSGAQPRMLCGLSGGLVQAREDLELAVQARATGAPPEPPEFDYLAYALCRIEGFRSEMGVLGLNRRAPASRVRGTVSADT